MGDGSNNLGILQRMAAGVAPSQSGQVGDVSNARAYKTAMARAAKKAANLHLSVLSTQDADMSLADAIDAVPEGALVLGLSNGQRFAGFVVCDIQFAAAVVEAQTLGRIYAQQVEPRKFTSTDCALVSPLIAGFLSELLQEADTQERDLIRPISVADHIASIGDLQLLAPETDYRTFQLSIDFEIGERQGQCILAIASAEPACSETPDNERSTESWTRELASAVRDAEISLDAVLHRFEMPMHAIEILVEGDVVPLLGANLSSAELVGPNGEVVTHIRLGQISGMRAGRIEEVAPANIAEPLNLAVGHAKSVGAETQDFDGRAETEQPGTAPVLD